MKSLQAKAHQDKEEDQSEGEVLLRTERRVCTDSFCLLLLVAMWLGMTIIGLASLGLIDVVHLKEGNPERLLHGVDYMGKICGVDEPVKGLDKRVMPNFYLTNPTVDGAYYVPSLFAVCVASCPAQGQFIADPYGQYAGWNADYDSKDFINNCLYVSQDRDSTSATTILSDFARTAGLIAILGFFIAVLCSMLFLFVIRIPLLLRSIVWFCVFFILAIFAAGGYLLLNEAKDDDYNRTEVMLLKSLGGILSGLAVFWLCVICFMRQRIALAISLIRESATALTSMPLLCFLPLLQTVFFAGFTALWMLYCLYLVSSGDIDTHVDETTGLSYKTISYDKYSQRAILYMLFAWLWSIGFLEALGQIGSAHAVLTWFFADIRAEITSFQVWKSMTVAARFHSGTAAVGSFIIAVIRGLRMMLEYVKYRLGKKKSSRLVKLVLCCMSCLLVIFEKVIKFLNKHAYIQCAMKGSSFFTSATRAYILLFKNLGRLAAVSVVGDFVVLIGKISITLTCSGAAYLYMSTYMRDELNGFVLPTVFVGFLAFTTSTMFLGVLSATADALLQAVIVDEEESKKSKTYKPQSSKHEGLRDLVISKSKEWKLNEDNDPMDEQELQSLAYDYGDEDVVGNERGIELPRIAYDLENSVEEEKDTPSPIQSAPKAVLTQPASSANKASPMFAPGSRYSKSKSALSQPPLQPPPKKSTNPFMDD